MATQPQVRQSVLDDARRELALMVQRDTAAFGDARVFQQAFASNVDAKAAALGTSSAAAPSGAADTRDAGTLCVLCVAVSVVVVAVAASTPVFLVAQVSELPHPRY